MFKLQRPSSNKSTKSGERFDFKFSNFQALQVPKGWDRLFLSMISAESGKTVAKLGKALVRSGNCQWTETISESVWLSKESEDCVFKFVVSMGSSRAGILGETSVNMASYTSSKTSPAVLLPLKKCSHGTVLQVKIQCLTPRANISSKYSSEQENDEDVDHHGYNPNKIGAADTSLVRGISSSRASDVSSHQEDLNKELSYSSSGSNSFSDLAENSRKGEKDFSNPPQRHFGATSMIDSAHDNYPIDDSSFSSQSSRKTISRNTRMELQNSGKEFGAVSSGNGGSNLPEVANSTIEELRAEAKMWERNARKLMIDLDMLRSEFLDQSKKQADLVMELSAAYTEQDGLKKEVEQLKLMLEDATQKQRMAEDSTFQTEGLTPIQKELESEIKYQQQANANLSLQLQRSQESNIELVSILQELEQTIEQQKAEIENLSALQWKHSDTNSSAEQNLIENKDLLLQLQQLKDSEKTLETNVYNLEKALHEKVNELEKERRSNSQSLLDVERDYKYQLGVKDEEIAKLEAKVQKTSDGVYSENSAQDDESKSDLLKELEILREKVQELERDCTELTDENLELLLKLKDSKNQSLEKCESFSSASSDLPTKSFSAQSDVSDTEPQMYDPEFKTTMKETEQWATFEASELFSELLKQLEIGVHILMKPLSNNPSDVSTKCEFLLQNVVNTDKKGSPDLKTLGESILKYFFDLNSLLEDRISEFERIFGFNEIEIQERNETIAEAQKKLEHHILKVQQHESSKAELEADFENLRKRLSHIESVTEKLQADLLVSNEQNALLISANELLERRSAELEVEKQKLESKLVQLEAESLLLQGNITGMDNLNENLQVMQAQLLEAQRQSECLSTENQDLQAHALRLTEERNTLQKLNEELQRKESELLERCEQMNARLERTENAFFDSSKKVEALEENLNSTLEGFSLKEKILKSELEYLLQEHKTSANQMHLETLAEVENLQKEVNSLTKEISVVQMEKERVESEISSLLADKETLESAVKEVQSKLEICENELITLRAESQMQVQSLTEELTASKRSHATVMANNEKLMKQLATYRATEEKLNTTVNNLELKLTVTEYENQQLREDNASKKFHIQNVSAIQEEASVLRNKLEEYGVEKEKLEASLHTITADYESLKAEKLLCTERVLSLQKAMSEYEICKQKAISLEEKLLQVEGDLLAKETFCAEQKAHLENELSEVKEANKQYQLKLYQLEEEKSECLQKARALELELEKRNNLSRKDSDNAEVSEAEKMNKIQLQSFSSEERSSDTTDSNKSLVDEHKIIRERFERTKSSLETELRDLRERYLQMSLKYAEVEAEREDLVMKLKSVRSGKRWFS